MPLHIRALLVVFYAVLCIIFSWMQRPTIDHLCCRSAEHVATMKWKSVQRSINKPTNMSTHSLAQPNSPALPKIFHVMFFLPYIFTLTRHSILSNNFWRLYKKPLYLCDHGCLVFCTIKYMCVLVEKVARPIWIFHAERHGTNTLQCLLNLLVYNVSTKTLIHLLVQYISWN